MLIFSFRAGAGRLLFLHLFFPYIDVASHVLVVRARKVYFQKGQSPQERRDPLYNINYKTYYIYDKNGLRHVMSLYMLPWCPQSIHILYISHINTPQHQNTNMAMRNFFSNVLVRRARHGPPQHAWGRQFALQCERATIGKRKRRPESGNVPNSTAPGHSIACLETFWD